MNTLTYGRTDKYSLHQPHATHRLIVVDHHLVLTSEGYRAGSASYQVAAGGSLGVLGSAHTAGMGRHTELAVALAVAPEVGVAAGVRCVLEAAAVVASSERPGATEPTQPNWLVVVDPAVEGPAAHMALVLHRAREQCRKQLLQAVAEGAHIQLLAVVSWSRAAAILRCCYWHTS